jgi:hypothetical protein
LYSPVDPLVVRIHDQLNHLLKISLPIPGAVSLTREQISTLIENAFWAGLGFNEGRPTRVCVVLAEPSTFPDAIQFANPVAYEESQIVRLTPAVPTSGCLLVSGSNECLSIWGFGRSRAGTWMHTLTIETSKPGIVRVGVGPFQPFAVLTGQRDSIIEGSQINLPHYLQGILRKALPGNDGLETQAIWRECLVLGKLAGHIHADGHGGAVLVVPTESGEWSASLNPFAFRLASPDSSIRDAIREELNATHTQGEALQQVWQTDLPNDVKNVITSAMGQRPWYNERDVRAIAALSRVDGAIVMTRDLRVLGFGAKIAVRTNVPPNVCLFRPEPGSQRVVISPLEEVGGTRHQSAARFVDAHRESVVLVVSQDGHMSVLHWHNEIGAVAVVRNAEWWI